MSETVTMQSTIAEAYTGIAPYYDYLLQHVDYQEWYDYLRTIMQSYVPDPKIIVELGCGTGRFGAKFSNDGFTIFGIDRSLEMLQVARTRCYFNFRAFCADIRNFALARRADFIFAVHDTLNYQITNADMRGVFRSVRRSLKPGGIFLFDVTTEYNIYENFDGKIKHFETRGASIEWSNLYDKKKKHISSLMTVKKGSRISSEEHLQRIYSIEEIQRLLEIEGFHLDRMYGDYTFLPPKRDTIMINFIAKVK